MFPFAALPMLMGLYPFNPISRGRDMSPNKAPGAKFSNVGLTKGPDGLPSSSVELRGVSNSFIQIPNQGKLRATSVISIFAWIKPNGISGPIVNYGVGPAWETHLWLLNSKTLFARYVKVGGALTSPVSKSVLRRNAWSFVGTSYDGTYARLWVNARNVATRKIGRIGLSTNGPIRIGAKIGDPRYYKGAIACVQLYRFALHQKQVERAMKQCIRREYSIVLEQFSKDCRTYTIAISTLSDWFKDLAPVYQPMRRKTKTNRELHTPLLLGIRIGSLRCLHLL